MIFKGLITRIAIYFLSFLCVEAECGQNHDVVTESKEFVGMVKLNVTYRGHERRGRGQNKVYLSNILYSTPHLPETTVNIRYQYVGVNRKIVDFASDNDAE